jgi:hypothetical protein
MSRNNENESRQKQDQQENEASNTVKNPDDWTTGGEEMTGCPAILSEYACTGSGRGYRRRSDEGGSVKKNRRATAKNRRGT